MDFVYLTIAYKICFDKLCYHYFITIPPLSVALCEKFANFVMLSNQQTYFLVKVFR